ncbi:MAG: DNA-processing protein DprA [Acidiferrobacterales bacterium]
MNPHALRCWSTLHRVPGLGAHAVAALLEELGSVEAIFEAPRSQLESLLGRAAGQIDAILTGPDAQALEQDLAWLAQPSHHILTLTDADYPRLLRETAQPPILLFVVGDKNVLARPQLAVVGSRNATPGGVANAMALAGRLARAGLAITSGLALGIDGAAHRGALDAGGRSVAVLGTGVDHIYPARHRELAGRIAANGAVISEFPLGTPPKGENFPRRNRIISGLSLGTLVVEAAMQSGSLITARFALEQGREVFAVPGSIHSPQARGCHALIRQGAKLVETAQDIIEELGSLAQWVKQTLEENRDITTTPENPRTAELLRHIGYDPVSIDMLVERSGLTAEYISSMLLEMELQGIVEACPGGTYMRV